VRWTVLTVPVLALAALTTAGTTATPLDAEAVHDLVSRIAARQRSVRTLEARFVQQRRSALLLEPETSRGRLWFRAPDTVRWEYETPRPMVVLFRNGVLSTWLPEDRTLERARVPKRRRRFLEFLVGTRPLDELLGLFRLAVTDPGDAAPWKIRLEPASRQVARRVRTIVLEVDRKLLLPIAVEYEEPDGDRTTFRFENLRVDAPIPDGRFELELPPDVTVRTMGAGTSGDR